MKKLFGKKSDRGESKSPAPDRNPYAQQPATDPYARSQSTQSFPEAGYNANRPGGLPSGPRAGGLPGRPSPHTAGSSASLPPPPYSGSPQMGSGYGDNKSGGAPGGYGGDSRYSSASTPPAYSQGPPYSGNPQLNSGYGNDRYGAPPVGQGSNKYGIPGAFGGANQGQGSSSYGSPNVGGPPFNQGGGGSGNRGMAPSGPGGYGQPNVSGAAGPGGYGQPTVSGASGPGGYGQPHVSASGAAAGSYGDYGAQRELTEEEQEEADFRAAAEESIAIKQDEVNTMDRSIAMMEDAINVGMNTNMQLQRQREQLSGVEVRALESKHKIELGRGKVVEIETAGNMFRFGPSKKVKEMEIQQAADRDTGYTRQIHEAKMNNRGLGGGKLGAGKSKYSLEDDYDDVKSLVVDQDNAVEVDLTNQVASRMARMEGLLHTMNDVATRNGEELEHSNHQIGRVTELMDKNISGTNYNRQRLERFANK
ncbi:hypothetical protein QBC46DRAFT_393252 [Diplogelasinospora grovesii]|uniref:t-SNARE coiled-coil homology domain-containing protein n=1 Tax=Diplogelasinospora grovesii TaxID=303347 RepID=A0AAN6N0Y2_9PEZI|nr:hypothetical protein QBC46DRAFT_393252 [Diplogelasinospora grovesii]